MRRVKCVELGETSTVKRPERNALTSSVPGTPSTTRRKPWNWQLSGGLSHKISPNYVGLQGIQVCLCTAFHYLFTVATLDQGDFASQGTVGQVWARFKLSCLASHEQRPETLLNIL